MIPDFFARRILFFTLIGIIIVVFGVQQFISISNIEPTCSIIATSKDKKANNNGDLFIREGEEVYVVWNSNNAKTANDSNGESVLLSGTLTDFPKDTVSYSYQFNRGNKKVTCIANVNVVKASIDEASLTSSLLKPTIFGTASGTGAIEVKINRKGTNEVVYKSGLVIVEDQKWKVEILSNLSVGLYDVSVSSVGDVVIDNVANGILIINKAPVVTSTNPPVISTKPPVIIPKPAPIPVPVPTPTPIVIDPNATTTVVVSLVPLLVGGTVHTGGSVPISSGFKCW